MVYNKFNALKRLVAYQVRNWVGRAANAGFILVNVWTAWVNDGYYLVRSSGRRCTSAQTPAGAGCV